MPKETVADLNRQQKQAIKRLLEGDESAMYDLRKISDKRIELLMPRTFKRLKKN
jgi:hypothetical protein